MRRIRCRPRRQTGRTRSSRPSRRSIRRDLDARGGWEHNVGATRRERPRHVQHPDPAGVRQRGLTPRGQVDDRRVAAARGIVGQPPTALEIPGEDHRRRQAVDARVTLRGPIPTGRHVLPPRTNEAAVGAGPIDGRHRAGHLHHRDPLLAVRASRRAHEGVPELSVSPHGRPAASDHGVSGLSDDLPGLQRPIVDHTVVADEQVIGGEQQVVRFSGRVPIPTDEFTAARVELADAVLEQADQTLAIAAEHRAIGHARALDHQRIHPIGDEPRCSAPQRLIPLEVPDDGFTMIAECGELAVRRYLEIRWIPHQRGECARRLGGTQARAEQRSLARDGVRRRGPQRAVTTGGDGGL